MQLLKDSTQPHKNQKVLKGVKRYNNSNGKGMIFMQKYKKIILIVIDTLNVDHLGCYGYDVPETPTTPFLDSLAEEGVLFQNHYATDVPTPSSFTSMFYGVRGIKHGIIGFNNNPLEFHVPSPHLAECLSKNGFCTGMISNLFYPCPWTAAGFQYIYSPGAVFQGGTAEEVTTESSRWLKAHAKEDFFLFVHYWDPHGPYFKRSKKEYREMFSADEYGDFAPDMKYIQKNKCLKELYKTGCEKVDNDDLLLPEEKLALYDANIRYVDDSIKKLFNTLKELGMKDETLVIITSDHGEAFGEYGLWDHLSSYRNISKLPLIFVGSSIDNKKISSYTQNIDIMPTILELADLDVPNRICGKTMVPILEGSLDDFRKEIVVNSDAGPIQRMYVKGDYALVHTLNNAVWDHIKEYELFDLSEDPDQVKDISSTKEKRTSEMRIALSDWLSEELKGMSDPLQLSVSRGGWCWGSFSDTLEPSELKDLTENLPELKKFFKKKTFQGLFALLKIYGGFSKD